MRDLARNKKAYHDYEILEEIEAGLVLLGSEIKAIRKSKLSLAESYISFKANEAFIKNMHISNLSEVNFFKHDELRDKKLLLHKKEITYLNTKVKKDGLSIIPLKLYLVKGRAKILIALARGKKLYDKRLDQKIKDMNLQAKKLLNR